MWLLEWCKKLWQRMVRRQPEMIAAPEQRTNETTKTENTPAANVADRSDTDSVLRDSAGPHETIIPPPPTAAPDEATFDPNSRSYRDAETKRLLKARMKHDVFVKPEGETPIPQPRFHKAKSGEIPQPKLQPPQPIKSGNIVGVDKYHTTGEDVYFAESEFYGEFNFRDTILEQLDLYWYYLARMKKRDPDAYEFYKQVGIVLIPYASKFITYDNIRKTKEKLKLTAEEIADMKKRINLSQWFSQVRPAFGCIATGITVPDEAEMLASAMSGEKDKLWIPRFIYFNKYAWPPVNLQQVSGGCVYCLTIWWDHPGVRKLKHGVPQEYGVHLSEDGKIKLLRWKTQWNSWEFPAEFKRMAKVRGVDAQTLFGVIFCDLLHQWEHAHYSMVRVTVTKGEHSATFGVAANRIPYFFKDRDITLTRKGRKERIFHPVRPHFDRNGKAVPMTFRGLQDFKWAGYDVHISVPGKDHPDFDREFDVGLVDISGMSKAERRKHRFITAGELGRRFNNVMRKGFNGGRQ
jgi:hypothetical protein